MMFEFKTKLKGVSFDGRQDIVKSLAPETELTLKAEPDNQYDANAVAVFSGEQQVGYIARETAEKIQKDVLAGKVKAIVKEVTGGDNGRSYGCNVSISVEREDKND